MIQPSTRNEWLITAAVILCAAVLLVALAVAIGGNPFQHNKRVVTVMFSDITGVRLHSEVRYAGARAGRVAGIRMLTPSEREASNSPDNAVEVSVALNPSVPELTAGSVASITADTILADKFILISPGPASAEVLPPSASLNGVSPTTIDALSAQISGSLSRLNAVANALGSLDPEGILGQIPAVMKELGKTISQAQAVLTNADGLITNGVEVVNHGDTLITSTSEVVGRAGEMIDTSTPEIQSLLTELRTVSKELDEFASRANELLAENQKPIASSTRNLERAVADLRVTSAYARSLLESLNRRPQQLIWGTRREPNRAPTEEEIFQD